MLYIFVYVNAVLNVLCVLVFFISLPMYTKYIDEWILVLSLAFRNSFVCLGFSCEFIYFADVLEKLNSKFWIYSTVHSQFWYYSILQHRRTLRHNRKQVDQVWMEILDYYFILFMGNIIDNNMTKWMFICWARNELNTVIYRNFHAMQMQIKVKIPPVITP